MANSTYEILEFRAVIKPHWTELYVLCSPDSDGGILIGGWYKKTIPPTEPALSTLTEALLTCDYLKWDKGCNP